MTDLAVIIPSRGRPESITRLADAWHSTTNGAAHLYVCLDLDDPTAEQYPRHLPDTTYLVGHRNGFAPRLTAEARKLARDHFAVASWGDDHLPRTVGWDTAILDALHDLQVGFVYGDDLLQGEALPTACAMTSNVVTTLGWMTPPGLAHLFVDDAWLRLGRELDRIRYLPDVVIEHMHPVTGKTEWDDLVRDANTPAAYESDRAVFDRWCEHELHVCVEKLRAQL